MKKTKENNGITLIALIITIIVLLILSGIAIGTLGGENGLFTKTKKAKEKYSVSEAKEKLELEITNLQIEQQGKGEELKKGDLPKMNNDEIDVRDTTNFPIEVIYKNYKFEVDSNFQVTYVGEANETIITYTTEPDGYTNQNKIKVLVTISNPKGIKSILKPGETDKILPQNRTTAGIEFTVTKNGHYELKVEDVDGNETIKDIYINLIDTIEPKDFNISVSKSNEKITISGETQDGEETEESTKSGIDHYEYCLVDEANITKTYTEKEIPTSELSGTYNIYVMAYDRAGNNKKSNTTQISVIGNVKAVSGGNHYTLFIDNRGKLWGCGSNGRGQLGDGTTTSRTSPVQVKKETRFIQISSGCMHSLAIDSEGNLWTWGNNENGELGDGTTMSRTSPEQIKKETKFIQISAGYDHSIAIDNEGNLWAWGSNYQGQLGNERITISTIPVQIKSETKFTQASAGRYNSLAIDNEGNLWAWGYNSYGQLGDGTTINRKKTIKIKENIKFTQVSAQYHSLAIDREGDLWTWGYNYYGQLGDGTTINRASPVKISIGIKFKQILAGVDYSLAIDNKDNLWAWGSNYQGQLGINNTSTKTSYTPIQVKKGTKFTQVSAGDYHSMAIDNKGNLWTWGNNLYGELGDGTTTDRSTPVQIN